MRRPRPWDPTLGYPGEGPPNVLELLLGGAAAEPASGAGGGADSVDEEGSEEEIPEQLVEVGSALGTAVGGPVVVGDGVSGGGGELQCDLKKTTVR